MDRVRPLVATVIATAIAAVSVGLVIAPQPVAAYSMRPADAIAYLNRDGDERLDWSEIDYAARRAFTRLDRKGDGRIPFADLADRLNRRSFDAVNPDKDGTLELDEWMALVRRRFDAADQSHDGKLTRKELVTPAGKALLDLLLE